MRSDLPFGRADGKNLGQIKLPLLPQYLVIQDRGTGTWYVVRHSEDGARVSITPEDEVLSQAEAWRNAKRYASGEEPVLGTNPRRRLIIRNGRLGYSDETLSNPVTDRNNAPLLTRRSTQRRVREIVEPDTPSVTATGVERLAHDTVMEP